MSVLWILAFAGVAIINSALALVVLLHRTSDAPAGIARVFVAAVAVSAATIAEAIGLAVFGLGVFGFMHLAWIDVSIVVPLSGMAVLAGRLWGKPSQPVVMVIAALSLAVIPIAIDAMFITPFDLRLERAEFELPAERAGKQPIKIAVLADLQATTIGDHERDAIATLMATEPDLILIPGDVFQGSESMFHSEVASFRSLLSELQAPGGVYAVRGNTDSGRLFHSLFEGTDIQVLSDEVARFEFGDRQIALLGLSMSHFAWDMRCNEFVNTPGDEEVRILMGHVPDVVKSLPRGSARVDLTVAGHTHGGQVSFPFIGPPVVLSTVPNHVAAGGLHEIDDRRIYVSRGVGMERGLAPRIRWRVPPEVSLITVR